MNPLRDRIVAKLDTLPDVELREVIDFMEFLSWRAADDTEPLLVVAGSLTGVSLTSQEIDRELYGDRLAPC